MRRVRAGAKDKDLNQPSQKPFERTQMSDGRAHTNPIFNSHRLKLGTFCTNTVSAITRAPELTEPTWANMLAAARLADGFGFEAMVEQVRDDAFECFGLKGLKKRR